jgi:hypothetical protein
MLAPVHPRFAALVVIPGLLMIGGCGGSGHSSSSVAQTTSSTTTTLASTSTTTTASKKRSKQGSTGAINARIPARFEVLAGGRLNPPQISIPAEIPVQVTVVSKDGRSHRVVVMTSPVRPLSVPAGGQSSVLITGLKAGRYPIKLDGTAAGLLVTGVNPGP